MNRERFFRREHFHLPEPSIPFEIEEMTHEQYALYKGFLVDPRAGGSQEFVPQQREEVAEYARALGDVIDTLSEEERHAYISAYCTETGFPDSFVTSEKILSHTVENITKTCDELDLTIAYAGYANTCSVGKAMALPGSDMDFLTIVVRESGVDAREFDRVFTHRADLRLVSANTPPRIFSQDEVNEIIQFLPPHNHDIPSEKRERMKWSDATLYSASAHAANVRMGGDLVNRLNGDELDQLTSVDVGVHVSRGVRRAAQNEPKYEARDLLLSEFSSLPTNEQFVIVRMLQSSAESIALNITHDGPHADSIQSLYEKGLLTAENGHLKAPWAPYPWVFRNQHIFFYTGSDVEVGR